MLSDARARGRVHAAAQGLVTSRPNGSDNNINNNNTSVGGRPHESLIRPGFPQSAAAVHEHFRPNTHARARAPAARGKRRERHPREERRRVGEDEESRGKGKTDRCSTAPHARAHA